MLFGRERALVVSAVAKRSVYGHSKLVADECALSPEVAGRVADDDILGAQRLCGLVDPMAGVYAVEYVRWRMSAAAEEVTLSVEADDGRCAAPGGAGFLAAGPLRSIAEAPGYLLAELLLESLEGSPCFRGKRGWAIAGGAASESILG